MGHLFNLSIVVIVISVTLLGTAASLDTSECDVCDGQYSQWLRNKSSNAYWQSHPSPKEAGDHICQWTSDVYHGCYSKCGRDSNGTEVSNHHTRKAIVLKNYAAKYCADGACRLADTQTCAFSGRLCDQSTKDCMSSLLDHSGCMANKLCTAGERRAYSQTMLNELSCQLGYPDNMAEGGNYSLAEVQGLQQCKDIIIVKCLSTWSDKEYDLTHITNYSNETNEQFCRGEEAVVDCINAISNGTVDYAGHTYTTPCKLELLKHPDHVDKIKQQISHVYGTLCSGFDPCAVTNSSTEPEPITTTEPAPTTTSGTSSTTTSGTSPTTKTNAAPTTTPSSESDSEKDKNLDLKRVDNSGPAAPKPVQDADFQEVDGAAAFNTATLYLMLLSSVMIWILA